MAVSDFAVAVSDAPRGAFPYELPTIGPNLKAVGIIPSVILISHEPQKCHVHRSHSQLEGLKMQTKVLPKTVEDLERGKLRAGSKDFDKEK